MAQKLESAWDRRGFSIRRVSPAPHLDLRCRLSRELQAGSGRLFPAKHARTLGGRRLESAAEAFGIETPVAPNISRAFAWRTFPAWALA